MVSVSERHTRGSSSAGGSSQRQLVQSTSDQGGLARKRLRLLGLCFRAATSQRAATVYTFVAMVATLVTGGFAWKLSNESLQLSRQSMNMHWNGSAKPDHIVASMSSDTPRTDRPAERSLLPASIKRPSHFLHSTTRHSAADSFAVDMLFMIAITALFVNGCLVNYIFGKPSDYFIRTVSALNYFMCPALLVRFSRDAPEFYNYMEFFSLPIFSPILWEFYYKITPLIGRKAEPASPTPVLLLKASAYATHVCRVMSVGLILSSLVTFFSTDTGHDIFHLGVALKTFFVIIVSEIQLRRSKLSGCSKVEMGTDWSV